MSLVNAELAKIAVNTLRDDEDLVREHARATCASASPAPTSTRRDRRARAGHADRRQVPAAARSRYGGPCFPRDNKAFAVLARDLGTDAPLAEATDSINDAQTERLARIVRAHLAEGDAVGILGLAYKPDTDVVDESPGVALASMLADAGVREINVFDPVATECASSAVWVRDIRRAAPRASCWGGPTWS